MFHKTAEYNCLSGEHYVPKGISGGHDRGLRRRSPVTTGAQDAGPQREHNVAGNDRIDNLALSEGRITTLDLGSAYLVCVYTPNSKDDLSRLSLRETSWDPEFLAYLQKLEETKPVITLFNI